MSETRLQIRITPELLARLDGYCNHTHTDRSTITRLALVEYLDKNEPRQIVTGYPTDGEMFCTPDGEDVISVGRVQGRDGMHVIQHADGRLTTIGGYHLRRPNEKI